MRDKRGFMPPAVGLSSLLVIFAVLCISVFAMLSISTVRADVRLLESSARADEQWYAADYAANEILARLREGEVPDGVSCEKGIYSYACPISDTRELRVEVSIDGSDFNILRWQACSSAAWETDDTLPVWNGGEGG